MPQIQGDLQAQIMTALWRLESGTVEQVRSGLPPRYRGAYTTVQTVLNRLADRGLLVRTKRGNAIVYTPKLTEAEYVSRSIERTLAGASTHARPQSAEENCTIHNYNVVPIRGKYILTLGNYQAGTWVVDFTDPANAFTRAFSDPPAPVPNQLGGAWSSYWYNRNIYESSITEGVNIFRYQERRIRRR